MSDDPKQKQIALVTGASRGIGRAVALALARTGRHVLINCHTRLDAAGEVLRAIEADGGSGEVVPFDVADCAAAARAIEGILARHGRVDILVNNAGVPEGMGIDRFLDMDPDLWARYVDVNLYGSLRCAHAVAPGMVERGWGRIIQISSAAGRMGLSLGVSLYGGAKAGIEGAMRHLAVELGPTGVTVNSLALGLMGNVDDPATANIVRGVPVGRLGTPADAGAAVAYLASPEASWLTGQTIHLNGGALTA